MGFHPGVTGNPAHPGLLQEVPAFMGWLTYGILIGAGAVHGATRWKRHGPMGTSVRTAGWLTAVFLLFPPFCWNSVYEWSWEPLWFMPMAWPLCFGWVKNEFYLSNGGFLGYQCWTSNNNISTFINLKIICIELSLVWGSIGVLALRDFITGLFGFTSDLTKCRKCSYNLRGNTTGICPECGRKMTTKQVASLNAGP
jgi:hypothetical protein